MTVPDFCRPVGLDKLTRLAVLVGVLLLPPAARAVTINLSTNAPAWTVTGGGALKAKPFLVGTNTISITSNGRQSGTFAAGGSLAGFHGAWTANAVFTLPPGATDVRLTFSNLLADDRVGLFLNRTQKGDYFLNGSPANPPLTGEGLLARPFGPFPDADSHFLFQGLRSGTVTTDFYGSATTPNVLTLVVNNTNLQSLNARTTTFQNAVDGTTVSLTATLTYNVVPEPTVATVGVALAATACLARRHRRAGTAPRAGS